MLHKKTRYYFTLKKIVCPWFRSFAVSCEKLRIETTKNVRYRQIKMKISCIFSYFLKDVNLWLLKLCVFFHAQNLPHNDGHWRPCCIPKPSCTDTARGNHTQASTARVLLAKGSLGMEKRARCRAPSVGSGQEGPPLNRTEHNYS